jgi:drug/metabolite transporter (DMT)-like permease
VLLAIAAGGSMVGLRLTYAALARGKVGIVIAIVSTEGAIAALIAIALGEELGLLLGLGLAVVTAGVAAVGFGQHADDSAAVVADNRRAAAIAGAASIVFGSSLWASGDVGRRVGDPTVVLASRVLGVLFIALPLIVRRRLRTERPALWLALLTGIVECVGFLGFLWGAGDGLAVAAVIATQYAVIATVLSRLIFKERLSPFQLAGIGVVVVGVVLIALSRTL